LKKRKKKEEAQKLKKAPFTDTLYFKSSKSLQNKSGSPQQLVPEHTLPSINMETQLTKEYDKSITESIQ
jgi:hypothetical protein